ncbi:Methyltransferase-like protein 17, mitochondrial [Araneus ventricosus]|uniref:Methyltransferase-like protein 17, mitochondrial n=1 Tax=Araneus ventricosus TaxID=182803 RepID=A0A4Y2LM56_ARAVE|nr:Methyltransferase-like protein 17, mitochondrial [Araneus ventricosus]GBN15881.1 Methyltransferase-like protein 17, mitochondrial [Araneus ventricosus]
MINSYIYHFHKCCFSSKHSVELLPEVQTLLDSGDMKHRKHPGIRKFPPLQLPANLIDAVYRLVSNENEKRILKEAAELKSFLASRRLPMEEEEVKFRLEMHFGPNKDEMTKEQLIKAKRNIRCEFARWKPIEYDYYESLAYLAGRLPSNYASIYKVFSEINSILPSFQPKSFFDFGSGVGSAVWAANAVWEKSIDEYFCVDSSPSMNDIAQALLTDENTGKSSIKNIFYRQFLPASDNIKYDLVVSAFSLLDLPSVEDRVRTIDTLWRKTKDILVIIENGNLSGFFSMLDARDYILQIENQLPDVGLDSNGAHVVIPCPHEFSCPLMKEGKKKPCGFYVPYEDIFPRHRTIIKKDWISYVVLRKGSRPTDSNIWPRIVQPVLKKSRFVICRACCSDGMLKELTITKVRHGRHAYRCARSSSLGDLLPLNIEQLENNKDVPLTEDCPEKSEKE